jgi:hypothetical protein
MQRCVSMHVCIPTWHQDVAGSHREDQLQDSCSPGTCLRYQRINSRDACMQLLTVNHDGDNHQSAMGHIEVDVGRNDGWHMQQLLLAIESTSA